jgi:hypothetical protein
MNARATSTVLAAGPDLARTRRTSVGDGRGHQDQVSGAWLPGAADGALIGLVIGAVFGIATVWPFSLAAVTGGVIVGAASATALSYLHLDT